MSNCKKEIQIGVSLRVIITILVLCFLKERENKYFNVLLGITLVLLDMTDIIFLTKKDNCCQTLYYQKMDKICDVVTYLLLLWFFKMDEVLYYFIFYRLVGVILFVLTNNNWWLIIFFDFVKEYLIYDFVFGKNYTYMPIMVACKVIFEYVLHKIHNKYSYQEVKKSSNLKITS